MTEPAAASPLGMVLPRSWSLPSAFVALLLATAVLLWPTVSTLVNEWEDTENLTYTHGYLIALVSAWLLWRGRPLAQAVPIKPESRMLVGIALLSFVWLLAYRSNIKIAHQLLLPLLGWCVVYAGFGWHVARRCVFAFAFLYFAVPIWSFGNEILQSLTVVVVRNMLQLTGIPAYVTGNFVHIPSGVFEIAGGCSGLHFFIVAVAIGALYGEIHRDTWRVRVATIGLAMILALLTNWIRVFTLIVLGHASEMQHYLVAVEHYNFGWVLFAGAMIVFFLIARRFPPAPEVACVGIGDTSDQGTLPRVALLAALVALAVGPTWLLLAPVATDRYMQSEGLPSASGWQGPIIVDAREWRPVFEGADVTALAEYRRSSVNAQVFVATYFAQRQGKELVGHDNAMIGNLRTAVTPEKVHVDGQVLNSVRVAHSGGDALILHYYEIGGHRTASARAAQLIYGWRSLFSLPLSRAVGVYAVCESDCSAEQLELMDLLTRIHGGTE